MGARHLHVDRAPLAVNSCLAHAQRQRDLLSQRCDLVDLGAHLGGQLETNKTWGHRAAVDAASHFVPRKDSLDAISLHFQGAFTISHRIFLTCTVQSCDVCLGKNQLTHMVS